ncbi:MAG TPA: DNA/RNA non-specific endonuclease [Actinomycetota bacterium]|nr:DNA/RNA non-specific endonuclease [Actinomycetota bacterium]
MPLAGARAAGNRALSRVLARVDTRQAIKERDRPSAESTRSKRREETQLRQARNRLATVNATRAENETIAADQNMGPRTVGSIHYSGINNWRRGVMTAEITPDMLGTGSPPSVPISGWTDGYARGHLLARSLGGDGADVRNLVPIAHVATNVTEMWHTVEKPIWTHLRTAGNEGHRVKYTVAVDYAAGRNVVPKTLRFHARCYDENGIKCDDLEVVGSIANAAV